MSIGLGIGVQRPKQLRSIYSVDGKVPGFTADFIKNRYPGYTSLSSAITHARSGNATMTDGYGPELVVNGGFDSDSDWTKGTGISISSGVATFSSAAFGESLTQSSLGLTVGKTYVITLQVSNYSAGYVALRWPEDLTSDSTKRIQSNGSFTFIVTAASDILSFKTLSTATLSIDSVSVREMPVIKWAPHNLLTYSEDYSSWSGNALVESETTTAPDGVGVATKITDNQTGSIRYIAKNTISVADTGTYTACVFIKKDQDETRFPAIILAFRNGTGVDHGVQLNTKTGAVDEIGSGADSFGAESVGDYWKLSVTGTNNGTGNTVVNFEIPPARGTSITTANVGATGSIFLWGAHVYRSDLGGMVNNPDQPLSRASYVPTTSSAKWLPRVGHHVYNGSAWANEGLLAESEARTNLLTYSNDFSQWNTSNSPTVTDDNATSPDGTTNATALLANGTGGFQQITLNPTLADNTDYNVSVYYKAAEGDSGVRLALTGKDGTTRHFNALSDGSISTISGATSVVLQEIGNGWYRLSGVIDSASGAATPSVRIYMTDSSGGVNTLVDGDGIYIYGAQLEAASTPSSLIPTSGSSVTRASESFTIPSANLPWPEPNYIGSELVTNGTFDTDSDWTISSADPVSGISGGQLFVESGGLNAQATQGMAVSASKVYKLSYDLVAEAGTGLAYVRLGGVDLQAVGAATIGTNEVFFVPDGSSTTFKFMTFANDGASFTLDNISVREINPLSVSIAMDGRMTYADINSYSTVIPYSWRIDNGNKLDSIVSTNASDTGGVYFRQSESSVFDEVSDTNAYTFGINVPFNLCGRYGSTFINGAIDGVSLTANTTPTALVDLSSTDLDLAYVLMGTVGTFRVWDRDITDDGLVEATNPSLEPSLSLTFEGAGTNSFVVNDWSE